VANRKDPATDFLSRTCCSLCQLLHQQAKSSEKLHTHMLFPHKM